MGGRRLGVRMAMAAALASLLLAAPVASPGVGAGLSRTALAATASPAAPVTEQLLAANSVHHLTAPTPPMGWDGYNRFGRTVTASIVEAAARALVQDGMQADGYTYVIVDGGWDLLTRSASGALQPNPRLFPHGIRPLAAYVHSLGLKFGIYASAGLSNCAGTSAGSFGHYRQDAATFASWGVDYVKLDWCAIPYQLYPSLTQQQASELLAREMSQAIAATGRPMLLDVNDNQVRTQAWTWAAPVSSLWRTTRDISPSYPSVVAHFVADLQDRRYEHPGAWNDPDMLEVGNGAMTTTDSQTQFSLWAEMAAPLIAGNDLPTMPAAVRSILTNRAVIAVDQDRLGRQGYPVADSHGCWVLAKLLSGGQRAVLLFNSTGRGARISTTALRVGMARFAAYRLVNLWTGATSLTKGAIAASVPAHGVVMYRVAGLVTKTASAARLAR